MSTRKEYQRSYMRKYRQSLAARTLTLSSPGERELLLAGLKALAKLKPEHAAEAKALYVSLTTPKHEADDADTSS